MFTYIFKLDFEPFRLIAVGVTGYLNLRLLYKVSLPLSFMRKILLIMCSLSFCIFLLFFKNFFLIETYNLLSFVFILIILYADNYIVDFLMEIYDKIVLWIEKIKNRKCAGENR